MSGYDRPGGARQEKSLIVRIDQALNDLPDLRSGIEPYRRRLTKYGATVDEAPRELLHQVAVDVAADLHRGQTASPVTLLEFSDGAFDVLFDATHELTVLMHGVSIATPANSRDNSYHRGFPARAGFDKGHAMAHAQGGREGGPNYFPQAPRVNRRLSPLGSLWRDIETYLARNPGLFCFVRLAYSPGLPADVSVEAEYGLVAEGHFRTVIFPNA